MTIFCNLKLRRAAIAYLQALNGSNRRFKGFSEGVCLMGYADNGQKLSA